jgi:hypothetical protein
MLKQLSLIVKEKEVTYVNKKLLLLKLLPYASVGLTIVLVIIGYVKTGPFIGPPQPD